MPFGLCNALSTFQVSMSELLKPFIHHFITVFFDDILVYSSCLADHILHLEQVFKCLTQNQFYLKESKCSFAQQRLEYLGHIVFSSGVEPDPSKIHAMV